MGNGVRLITPGSVQIEFIYKGVRCRERIKFNSKTADLDVILKKAEDHRESILDEIANGTFNYLSVFPDSKTAKKLTPPPVVELTVGIYLDRWLDERRPHLKISTYEGYRRILKALKGQFGNTPLTDLTKNDVRNWCKTLTCTNGTIHHHVVILKTSMHEAYSNGLVSKNELDGFSFVRQESPKKPTILPFNKDEQAAILSVLSGQHKTLIQFAFWTGLRTSELIALEWGDINWEKSTLFVQRSETAFATKPEAPKTKAGTRRVKLLPPALEALRNQKWFTGGGVRIFLDPRTGKHWAGDQPIRVFWKKALLEANIPYRKPYQTRHTYASMMLSAGENLAWVSKQMGHSSSVITGNTYATWVDDNQPEMGNKAVDLFS